MFGLTNTEHLVNKIAELPYYNCDIYSDKPTDYNRWAHNELSDAALIYIFLITNSNDVSIAFRELSYRQQSRFYSHFCKFSEDSVRYGCVTEYQHVASKISTLGSKLLLLFSFAVDVFFIYLPLNFIFSFSMSKTISLSIFINVVIDIVSRAALSRNFSITKQNDLIIQKLNHDEIEKIIKQAKQQLIEGRWLKKGCLGGLKPVIKPINDKRPKKENEIVQKWWQSCSCKIRKMQQIKISFRKELIIFFGIFLFLVVLIVTFVSMTKTKPVFTPSSKKTYQVDANRC